MESEGIGQSAEDESEIRFAILRSVLGEEIAAADRAVSNITGYSVSKAEDAPFVRFTEWQNAKPKFIATWLADAESQHTRYMRFVTGLEAARTAYAAASYHLNRLREMESEVHRILGEFDFSKSVPKNSTVAIGSMRKCDFEYHAFVMAFRRALDGLAWGLSTYFKAEQSSFRDLAKHVLKYHPPTVAAALDTAVQRHIANFGFVIGDARGKSTRDRIAHKEAIQSGCINLMASGHFIMGGGENLGFGEFPDVPRMSEILDKRLSNLQSCICDILKTFQLSVDEFEANET